MVDNFKSKIICTGDPGKDTVANGVKQFLPDTKFLFLSNGDDLRLWDDDRRQKFSKLVTQSTVFINASKICQLGQLQLLNHAYETFIENKMKSYTVINIGSTAEFHADEFEMYHIEKNALKERSRQLANRNGFKSSHITISNINNLSSVGKTIKLVLDSDPFISLVKIEN